MDGRVEEACEAWSFEMVNIQLHFAMTSEPCFCRGHLALKEMQLHWVLKMLGIPLYLIQTRAGFFSTYFEDPFCRCVYSTSESRSKPKANAKAVQELWGINDRGRSVPLYECDIALITYEALLKELRSIYR